MKPSPHITQPELEAYLSGKLGPEAKAKVDQLLGECELSREAVAGFTAVPGALNDLPALKQQIATDGHAPGQYRSLTVRNQDPWYQAFGVKEGQKLYLAPDKRVKSMASLVQPGVLAAG